MRRKTWSALFVSAGLVFIAGCAALAPEGTRYAQMDFPQFTQAAIGSGSPTLAKRFGATRAAVCRATRDFETGPCVSGASSFFSTPAVPKDPDMRLAFAFDNWCAAHGGSAKPAMPSRMGRRARGTMTQSPEFYFSDFGTAVGNLLIKAGQEISTGQVIRPYARQCFVGQSSVGLITAVMASGLNENGVYERSVLALFYDEEDLEAFTQSAAEASRNNGIGTR